jgi:hypothetical protein
MADASAGGSLFGKQRQLEIVDLITSQEDASNQLSSRISIEDPLWCSKRKLLLNFS